MEKKYFEFFIDVRRSLLDLYEYFQDSSATAEPFYDSVSPTEMKRKLRDLKEYLVEYAASQGMQLYREYHSCSNFSHFEELEQDTVLVMDDDLITIEITDKNNYANNAAGEFFEGYREGVCPCNNKHSDELHIREYLVCEDKRLEYLQEGIASVLLRIEYAIMKSLPNKRRSAVREQLLLSIISVNQTITGINVDDFVISKCEQYGIPLDDDGDDD